MAGFPINQENSLRPAIPEPIKREVRQRCGFGCILCGKLVCDYEHIVPWSECRSHDAENIVLLCTEHHREVTANRIAKERLEDARLAPFARHPQRRATYSFEIAPQRVFHAGGNLIYLNGISPFHIILAEDGPVATIEFEYGFPLSSLRLLDPFRVPMLLVCRNEVIINSEMIWDVELTGTNFIVRKGKGDIVLHIVLDSGMFVLERAKMRAGKADIEVLGSRLVVNHRLGRSTIWEGNVIEASREYAFIRFGPKNPQHPVSAVMAYDV